MQYEVKVEYSEALIKQAMNQFWLKSHLKDLIILAATLIFTGVSSLCCKLTWHTTVLYTVLFIYGAVLVAVYFISRQRSLSVFRKMRTPIVQWQFTEETFATHSDLGSSEMKWGLIKKIWRFSNFWIIFYFNGSFSTLPTANLSDEIKNFIVSKVTASGGKVE